LAFLVFPFPYFLDIEEDCLVFANVAAMASGAQPQIFPRLSLLKTVMLHGW
jgi:hypothetical protein